MRLRAPGIIWIDFQIVVAKIIVGLTIVKVVIWLLIVQTEIISSSIGGMISKTEWL